ncbi:unnamed protein product [Schistocephalus solidus]|uniref:RRM domain-containing protein n=1 Tax=Schistocephalus solidus TaxID=70667 RepID=A0A183TRW4_SCHSO|nr:unnamed protein product [Schistocephalus solidus]
MRGEPVCIPCWQARSPLYRQKIDLPICFLHRSGQELKLEPGLPDHPLGTTKQRSSSPVKPAQQEQLQRQQEKELKAQQKREQKKQKRNLRRRKRRKEAREWERPRKLQEQKLKRQHKLQQRKDLKEHRALGRSPDSLELYVAGVKSEITVELLKTYFGLFGEVLGVFMFMHYTKTKHLGSGYITLRPTGDPSRVLEAEHVICGLRFNVRKCKSADAKENKSKRWFSNRLHKDKNNQKLNGNTLLSKQKPALLGESVQKQRQRPQDRAQKPSQQQKHLQNQKAARSSGEFLDISVDGLKPFITAGILKTYFSRFGEVLAVDFITNPSSNGPCGRGFISLRLKKGRSQVLHAEHFILGARIYVKEYNSSDVAEDTSRKLTEGNNKHKLASEPIPPRLELEVSIDAIQQQQQQPNLPRDQQLNPKQQAVEKPESPLKLSLAGLTSKITIGDLRTHFASFGEVLDVILLMNPVKKKPNGNAYVIIQPPPDCNQTLEPEHMIRGTRISVLNSSLFDKSEE